VKLIIFDVDGTLTPDNKSTRFESSVVETLIALRGQDIALALASNQGGVGLRHWIEAVGGFGTTPEEKAKSLASSQTYPTAQDAFTRLATIAGEVTTLSQLPCRIYTCYAYQSKAGNWSPTPAGSEDDPMWSREWRKPNAGMLLQAMQDVGASTAGTLFVGDRDEDAGAALAAGVQFVEAKEFFA
jgi:histidinol phosphatase-like enzyme